MLDWESVLPLDNAQIEEFLRLQDSAKNVRHQLGLSTTAVIELPTVKVPQTMTEKCIPRWNNVPIPLLKQRAHLLVKAESYETAWKEASSGMLVLNKIYTALINHQKNAIKARNAVEQAVRERTETEAIATEIELHLSHFSFLEEFVAVVGAPEAGATLVQRFPQELSRLLSRADECLSFTQRHAAAASTDAALYAARYRQAVTRALSLVAARVVSVLDEIRYEKIPNKISQSNEISITLAALATCPRTLILRKRCAEMASAVKELIIRCEEHPEYNELRRDCVSAYIRCRTSITADSICQFLPEISKINEIVYNASKLKIISQSTEETERKLYSELFGKHEDGALETFLVAQIVILVDSLRNQIQREKRLEELVCVCSVLIANGETVNLKLAIADCMKRVQVLALTEIAQLEDRVSSGLVSTVECIESIALVAKSIGMIENNEILDVVERAAVSAAMRVIRLHPLSQDELESESSKHSVMLTLSYALRVGKIARETLEKELAHFKIH